ncbi:MAG: hypothetical protein ACXVIS_08000, partial [Halobacteriota archaeon]
DFDLHFKMQCQCSIDRDALAALVSERRKTAPRTMCRVYTASPSRTPPSNEFVVQKHVANTKRSNGPNWSVYETSLTRVTVLLLANLRL